MRKINGLDQIFQDGFDDAERGKRYQAEMYLHNWGRAAAEAYNRGWQEGLKVLDAKIKTAYHT